MVCSSTAIIKACKSTKYLNYVLESSFCLSLCKVLSLDLEEGCAITKRLAFLCILIGFCLEFLIFFNELGRILKCFLNV